MGPTSTTVSHRSRTTAPEVASDSNNSFRIAVKGQGLKEPVLDRIPVYW